MIGSINGSSSFNQMTDMRQRMFNGIDTNGDGKHDKDELASMLANAPEGAPSAEKLLSQLDVDGNGSLSQSEFEARSKGDPKSQGLMGPPLSADSIFREFDTDGDGSISKAEFESALSRSTGSTSASAADQEDDFIQTFLDTLNRGTSSTTGSSDPQKGGSSTAVGQMMSAAIKSYIQLSSGPFADMSRQSALASSLYV